MRFSPQRRAIFQHLNFKKCSEPLSFLTCSLQNALLATAACNFWFLLWPHDSAPAALTSLLFDSPDTRIVGKTQHFATSLTFGAGDSSFFWLSRYCIFFLLTLLHLLTLLSSDFTYFIYLLFICFSTLHIVGSLLFKLPSIIAQFTSPESSQCFLNFDERMWKRQVELRPQHCSLWALHPWLAGPNFQCPACVGWGVWRVSRVRSQSMVNQYHTSETLTNLIIPPNDSNIVQPVFETSSYKTSLQPRLKNPLVHIGIQALLQSLWEKLT